MRKKSAFTIIEIIAISLLLFAGINLVVLILNKTATRDSVVHILKTINDTGFSVVNNQDKRVYQWGWEDDSYKTSFRIAYQYVLPFFGNFITCENNLYCVAGYSSFDNEEYVNFFQENNFARFYLDKQKVSFALQSNGYCKNEDGSLCALIVVDVNNKDLPNRLGVDVFYFGIYGNGVFAPFGYNLSKEEIEQGCSENSLGETCAAKIMRDGWKIKSTKPNAYPIANTK